MKTRTMVLLLVSAACGLTAAVLVGQFSGSREEAKVVVVVAAREVPRGTLLKHPEEFFKLQAVSREAVPATALQSLDALTNQVVQRTLDAGLVCTRRDFAADSGLTQDLPLGSLALAVPVTLYSSVAGFAKPGDHVDLLCSVPDPQHAGQRLTKIFMQDVLVLAVNQTKETADRSSPIGKPSVVTLAVKPEQAERLTWVKDAGPVTLALRKTGDKTTPETPGARSAFAAAPMRPAPVAAPPPDRRKPMYQDIFNGTQAVRTEFASSASPAFKDK